MQFQRLSYGNLPPQPAWRSWIGTGERQASGTDGEAAGRRGYRDAVAGRTLAGPRFGDDDGSAGPQVTAALADYAAGRGSEHAVLAALDSARLIVPVVALPAPEHPAGDAAGDAAAPGAPRGAKSSEMALPTVIGDDGRAALPAFTGAATLARWRPEARPVPVPAARVWESGAKDASAVVIDIAGPVPFAVDGARLAALAHGRPVPLPHEDPDVLALAHEALTAEPAVAGYRLLPGADGTDLTLFLVPVPGCAEAALAGAAQRAAGRLLAGAGGRVRRGIAVAAGEVAAGPRPARPGGTGTGGAGETRGAGGAGGAV
jgi:hypothetical protein